MPTRPQAHPCGRLSTFLWERLGLPRFARVPSGKGRALRLTPPLRTRRASFPAPGSSLDKAPRSTRRSISATFAIGVCTGLTLSAHRAFNGAGGNHRLSNHSGLAVPHHSRDPRPVGSQPPFGAGHNPYPDHYSLAFACSDIPYPLARGRSLAGVRPPSLWEQWGLPRCTRVSFTKDLGSACPPAAQSPRGEKEWLPDLAAYLLVHACQPLWHVVLNDGSMAIHVC